MRRCSEKPGERDGVIEFAPWPHFSEDEIAAVGKVLRSGQVNYWTGNEGRQFEDEFARWAECQYAVALANGTVALDLALKALGVGPGDEVVVTARTFLASVSCIITAGATPVFADVDRDSQNLTADTVRRALTDRTRAVICVHLAGWPCDMDPIMALARAHDLAVIEDCAQAHGARYKGRPVGSIGHIGAWSFCQDKIMTTGGEGGMVTTNDHDLWSRMWSYKDHGKSWAAVYEREHEPGFRWLHEQFGTNWRMTEMQATIGRIQLRRMAEWSRLRNRHAQTIWDCAKTVDGLRVPVLPEDCRHAAYKCYVFVDPARLAAGWGRDRVIAEINALGVPCLVGSCPEVYLERAFDATGWRPSVRLPVAKELGETSLMFLVHPTLDEASVEQTCNALRSVMQAATREG
jgi:dTDP-4-amino-4,6-dideoxygalactose transaminase